MNEHIIIIEDDPGVRFFLEEALKGESYKVSSYSSYEEASDKIKENVDLIILDISLPGLDGLSAMPLLKKKTSAPVLIITAYGTKQNALDAVERGAADFFVKPVLLDELKIVVKRTLGKKKLHEEVKSLKVKELQDHIFHGVVGKSPQMKAIFKEISKIANKNLTVLITGETGTGKEEVAQLVHKLSDRKGELVTVNCASIPDNLLESELFGYEKGAFTGALQQKPGKFEVANNGTIILDEIGEMSPYLQAKLLRAVEKQEIERLGSTKTYKVDIRIVSTTNRVLQNEIRDGKFREDLYYRLAQIHLHVWPLRERRDDIAVLIPYVLNKVAEETGRLMNISEEVQDILLQYSWPGNVRELVGVVRRAAIMCDTDTIIVDDLPLHLRGDVPLASHTYSDKTLDDAISELEKKLILDALRKTLGSQSKAAKLLGISERSMWYRVKKYDIDPNIKW